VTRIRRRSCVLILTAACVTALACGLFALTSARPDPGPGSFDDTLRNPMGPRDHSQRVDRLDLIDTPDVFAGGRAESVVPHRTAASGLELAQQDSDVFPHRGTWTSPERTTDFPFTELIPSWNLVAPAETGGCFHVRTRDGRNREWSPWLYAGCWGRVVLPRQGDRVTRFAGGAVRTDMPLLVLRLPADAYQVRATLQSFDLDPAVSPRLRRVAVAYSGWVADPDERKRLRGRDAPVDGWVRDLPVPHVRQHDAPLPLRESVCLPACITMVMRHAGVERELTENALAVYDPEHGLFGNGGRGVGRAGALDLDGWLQRVGDWNQVKALIGRGQPVVAAVQTQRGEHVIVVRGFTASGDVIVNDPLDRGAGGTVRPAAELGREWFGAGGFACVIRVSAGR